MKKILSLLLSVVMCIAMIPAVYAAPAEGEFDAALRLEEVNWEKSADGTYYSAKVEYCVNVTNPDYQYMNVYVPAAYLEDGEVNGYNAKTAPIILLNNCMGWNSSAPGTVDVGCINAGFVFIACGARSRDLGENGKAPTPVVDLKSAVRMLRLNADLIPGDEERIVSNGTSGGGQMSSILGASGNMEEYYSYLYANGAAGISKLPDGTYVSTINDDIYAAHCFCPIADLAHGDQAYAWMRYGAGDTGYVGMFTPGADFDELQFELAERLAESYCEYLNSLGIVNEDGEVLTADALGSGSYYEQTLANISASFNAFMEKQVFPYSVTVGPPGPAAITTTYNTADEFLATYKNVDQWLKKNEDGTYSVTDLAGFIKGTNLVRNKDIPGYDTMLRTEENNAFGTPDQTAVHYSAGVAAVMAEMLEDETLTDLLDGAYYGDESLTYRDIFNAYIEEANDPHVVNQVYLMNATQILLDTANGAQDADFAPYWRTRNGTADEHTSFSTAYNLAMAAKMAGAEVDYSLVWGMVHGDAEGTTTGTFVNWVHEICGGTPAPETPAQPAPGGEMPPMGEMPGGQPPMGEPPAGGMPGEMPGIPGEPPAADVPAEPPVEEPSFESGVFTYTVVAGDTLWGIAKKCFGTGFKWEDIYEANKDTIKNPNLIFVGQKLDIYAP